MTHYICTGGCEGLSKEQGTCQASSCSKYQQLLDECNCSDEKHQADHSKSTTEENN